MTFSQKIAIALVFFSSPVWAAPTDTPLGDIPAKYKNLYVVKTDKKFIGAKVEILSSTGDVLTAQSLKNKKMVIDFNDAKHGTYTIRVSKGNDVKEFQYIKKQEH